MGTKHRLGGSALTQIRYLMDDPHEAQRLDDMVDAPAWVNRYVADWIHPGDRVLDVGCGGFHLAEAVARNTGAYVSGIDLSEECVNRSAARIADLPGCEAVKGDAHELPFEDNSFDLVYCRFVLEYLRDKARAVAEMKRVAKPGARVILQDLDGQLVWHYPIPSRLESRLNAVVAALEETGFDPFAGRKLHFLLRNAGFRDVKAEATPYHFYAGAIDQFNYDFWKLKLDIAKPRIVAALESYNDATEFIAEFLSFLRDSNSLTYSVMFTVTGCVPYKLQIKASQHRACSDEMSEV